MEDVRPCTSVALIVLCFTPRVAQKYGYTALMRAIIQKNESAVTALLEHNANPEIKDKVPQDGAQCGDMEEDEYMSTMICVVAGSYV